MTFFEEAFIRVSKRFIAACQKTIQTMSAFSFHFMVLEWTGEDYNEAMETYGPEESEVATLAAARLAGVLHSPKQLHRILPEHKLAAWLFSIV